MLLCSWGRLIEIIVIEQDVKRLFVAQREWVSVRRGIRGRRVCCVSG